VWGNPYSVRAVLGRGQEALAEGVITRLQKAFSDFNLPPRRPPPEQPPVSKELFSANFVQRGSPASSPGHSLMTHSPLWKPMRRFSFFKIFHQQGQGGYMYLFQKLFLVGNMHSVFRREVSQADFLGMHISDLDNNVG
jgi:hypothetical protein